MQSSCVCFDASDDAHSKREVHFWAFWPGQIKHDRCRRVQRKQLTKIPQHAIISHSRKSRNMSSLTRCGMKSREKWFHARNLQVSSSPLLVWMIHFFSFSSLLPSINRWIFLNSCDYVAIGSYRCVIISSSSRLSSNLGRRKSHESSVTCTTKEGRQATHRLVEVSSYEHL